MVDEARHSGILVDSAALEKELGVPVVPISAKKKQGFDGLFAAVYQQAHNPVVSYPARRYDESTRAALHEIVAALGGLSSHSAFDLDEHRAHRERGMSC